MSKVDLGDEYRQCVFVARGADSNWIVRGLASERPQHFGCLEEALHGAREHAGTTNVAILVLDGKNSIELSGRSARDEVGMVLSRLQRILYDAFCSSASPTYYKGNGVEIDTLTGSTKVEGVPIELTRAEKIILAMLVRNAGSIVRYDVLTQLVWGPALAENRQYLRVLMSALRIKLEGDRPGRRMIVTERGVGYGLVQGEVP